MVYPVPTSQLAGRAVRVNPEVLSTLVTVTVCAGVFGVNQGTRKEFTLLAGLVILYHALSKSLYVG